MPTSVARSAALLFALAALVASTAAAYADPGDPPDPQDPPAADGRTLDDFKAISTANIERLTAEAVRAQLAQATRYPHATPEPDFVKLDEALMLNGVSEISVAEAEALAEFEGTGLVLPDLAELDAEVAATFATWNPDRGGYLALDGVTELSEAAAKPFANWYGAHLSFNGLSKLDPGVAELLAQRRGFSMSLCGLTELDVETARSLSQWDGTWYMGSLLLDGLTSLNAEVAAELALFGGMWLHLHGLETLTDETADALLPYHTGDSTDVFANDAVIAALEAAKQRALDSDGDGD